MLAPFLHRLPGHWQYFTSLPAYQRTPLRTLWRAFEWRVRCALQLPTVVFVPKWQAKLSLNPVWKGAGVTLFYVVALSETTGTARLYAHDHGASSFTLGRTEEGERLSFTIETITLDAALAREGLERVDVIKMDVEGAEELILRGATGLFGRCRPKVIFEINPDAIARLGLSERGAWDFLAARGYRFFTMQEDGTLISATGPCGANVVALHPEQHTLPAV